MSLLVSPKPTVPGYHRQKRKISGRITQNGNRIGKRHHVFFKFGLIKFIMTVDFWNKLSVTFKLFFVIYDVLYQLKLPILE
jgi:hypothetical protein